MVFILGHAVTKRFLFLACFVAICIALMRFGLSQPKVIESTTELVVRTCAGPTMGTRYRVSFVAEQEATGPQPAIDALLAKTNRQMSTYDPQSELSRFNQYEQTDWFTVSPATAKVVAYCLELAAKSEGAFDPTVGPLVNLWGFGPNPSAFEPPNDAKIAAALERVGHTKVEARLAPSALRKSDPSVYLDLSAAAKGYGVDAVAELLADEGYTAFMVEIGGEVRTKGTKPDEQPWRIGVEAPDSDGQKLQRVLELTDQAIATSGDYRNFFMHEERRYSHTINPMTGKPVDHQLATVSVLAETCLEADALATALLVMGPERGYNWAVREKLAAMFVSRTDDNTWTEQTTPAWDALIPTSQAPLTEEPTP